VLAQNNSGSFTHNTSRNALNAAARPPPSNPVSLQQHQPISQARRIAPTYGAPPKGAAQPQRPPAARLGGYSSGSGGSVHQQTVWSPALPRRL
jgi:hypothetical protein